MRLNETLTTADKIAMLSSSSPIGIFAYIFQPTDDYYDLVAELQRTYYFSRSGYKIISPCYEELIDMVSETADEIIGGMIRAKYKPMWDKVFSSLIYEYEPINEFEKTDKIERDIKDDLTHGHIITDNGNTNTKIEDTTESENNDFRYGFNSVNAVPTDDSKGLTTVTTIGNKADNTTENTRTNSGVDNRTIDTNEEITSKGRNTVASKLLNSEIMFRLKNNFFDIVLSSIDEIVTLSVY